MKCPHCGQVVAALFSVLFNLQTMGIIEAGTIVNIAQICHTSIGERSRPKIYSGVTGI